MGICHSKSNVYPSTQEEKETNSIINKQIQEEAKQREKNDNSTFKVLLLGTINKILDYVNYLNLKYIY